MPAIRFSSADDLFEPGKLAALVGPVRAMSRTRLVTTGFTAAHHDRLELTLATGEVRRLIVKRVRVAADWTACRTGDQAGREALLLDEPALAAVWESIECPYLAYSSHDGDVGLLMNDLSPFLLPDVRAPLREDQEELLLAALAGLHARFWGAPVLDLPWLARADQYAGLLDARSVENGAPAQPPEALCTRVALGWAAARRRLPASIASALAMPAMDAVGDWAVLPRTLLHGDAKVANFALGPDRKVFAFDWVMLGTGPVSIDIGWYLAVNASRLARPQEQILARYRTLLSERLGSTLTDPLWNSLMRVAVVCGARMLLWSKALAFEADGPGARQEWAWWMMQLEAAIP